MLKASVATLAVAMALLAFGSSEASAWVCRAGGIGVSTVGRSWNVIDAKIIALRLCGKVVQILKGRGVDQGLELMSHIGGTASVAVQHSRG